MPRSEPAGETTLSDLRILDLSDTIAGAYCARLFADYGADVICIEPPSGNPLRNSPERWDSLARGKLSVTLDLHSKDGVALFKKLLEGANVVIETFSPGVMESLGLGYTRLYGIKRRVILTSVPPEDGRSPWLAGLNAFTATAIAAHNADAYEVPQHINISASACIAFTSSALTGESEVIDPEAPLFRMSEVKQSSGPVPARGAHTEEILCGELGLTAAELAELRAAGAV